MIVQMTVHAALRPLMAHGPASSASTSGGHLGYHLLLLLLYGTFLLSLRLSWKCNEIVCTYQAVKLYS